VLEPRVAVVAEAAVEALDADSVLVGIWEEPGGHVRVAHESGLSTAARRRLPAVLTCAAAALRGNAQPEAAALDVLAEALVGRAWGLAAPIRRPGRPLGVVFVGRTRGGPFSAADRRVLNALAAVAALALDRHRLAGVPRRLRSAVRRQEPDPRLTGSHVAVGDMRIDLVDQEVVIAGRRARLTPSELRILPFLVTEPGRARSRREILRHLWHTDYVGDERACDAHISNLRQKIERNPARPSRVVTVRGVGYALHVPRL
jgi:DNA-binding winged helix-turn-helix (wHTH) protein